jgi:hypothetical protein
MKFAQTLYIIASILMIVEWLLCTSWNSQCVLSVSEFWLGVVCSWSFVLIYWLPMVVLGSWLKEDGEGMSRTVRKAKNKREKLR